MSLREVIEGSVKDSPKREPIALPSFYILFMRQHRCEQWKNLLQDTEFSQSEHFFNTKFPYT